MERMIDQKLVDWKNQKHRKVLLLRGARQTGKTFSVRKLALSFKYFLEINFEENKAIHVFFSGSLDPAEINKKLSAYYGQHIVPGKTLLFFDEIQACTDALRALRFYHEKCPQLHVLAAGSLLEFALNEIPSFGVGRITSLFLYPLCFTEFLWAIREKILHETILDSGVKKPMHPVFHQKLLEHFRAYQILGGMPEVVKTYVEKNDFLTSQKIMDDLIKTLTDDFAKYKKRSPVFKLRETLDSIVKQTGSKFKYTNISDNSTSQTHCEALELLIMAGLAHKITHTSAHGIPLGAEAKFKKYKVIFFDMGLYHRLLGLALSDYLIESPVNLINKGSAAEMFVGLELLAHLAGTIHGQLFYWHRESPSSNAEVDYVIQKGEQIIPIEVKAGTKGQMQSLHLFLGERNLPHGVRISHENFARFGKIAVFPIYAIENLVSIKKF